MFSSLPCPLMTFLFSCCNDRDVFNYRVIRATMKIYCFKKFTLFIRYPFIVFLYCIHLLSSLFWVSSLLAKQRCLRTMVSLLLSLCFFYCYCCYFYVLEYSRIPKLFPFTGSLPRLCYSSLTFTSRFGQSQGLRHREESISNVRRKMTTKRKW